MYALKCNIVETREIQPLRNDMAKAVIFYIFSEVVCNAMETYSWGLRTQIIHNRILALCSH